MSLELRDSRRLTGPTLFGSEPGAAIEVAGEEETLAAAIVAWQAIAAELSHDLGWPATRTAIRRYAGGASLALTAPVDVLYAACEVNEAAWRAAVTGNGPDEGEIDALRALVETEARPPMLALRRDAQERGLTFLWDDDTVSIGTGAGARTWAIDALPSPSEVPWSELHDIPVALVTGTNGKTTTVRMLAAMATAAGRVAGNTSTDGVQIDGDFVLEGDYTGPEGARALLRNERVEIAFLETARGGMLRRGLPVFAADAALVTNVGTDHLGEWGICDLSALAEVKLVVARAVASGGCLILNRDDRHVVEAARRHPGRRAWFSLEDGPQGSTEAPLYGLRDGWLGRSTDRWQPLLRSDEIPTALGGAALHNLQNGLAAWAVASAIGLPDAAVAAGLRAFGSARADNPGRANLFDLRGLQVLADFGHNPEGVARIMELAAGLAVSGRTAVVLGQAGDRQDAAIRGMARAVGEHRPARVILKRMPRYLRGRQEGEVVAILRQGLAQAGYPEADIQEAPGEWEAACAGLAWAAPGDLLVLLLHAERERVMGLLEELESAGWTPGAPLPATSPAQQEKA